MIKKNFKGRCEKRYSDKGQGILKVYNDIQAKYILSLENNTEIKKIQCNVLLDEKFNDNEYTTDFVCEKLNDDLIVRECVQKKYLTKPLTVKLLDFSRNYWLKRGIKDWGIVINE